MLDTMQGDRLLGQSEGQRTAVFPFKSRKMKANSLSTQRQDLEPVNDAFCFFSVLLPLPPPYFKPYLSESASLIFLHFTWNKTTVLN